MIETIQRRDSMLVGEIFTNSIQFNHFPFNLAKWPASLRAQEWILAGQVAGFLKATLGPRLLDPISFSQDALFVALEIKEDSNLNIP